VTEGSLQRNGKKIRVNVRLLNVLDGSSPWAGTFDERFTDIFALQDTISERVVRALKLKLTPNDKSRLLKHHTDDAKAYQLYLKGRYYWWKNAPEEFGKSRDYFRRAVEADPSYALGYCGLNSYYGFGAAWGMLSPEDAWHKAEWAITKALKLDDSLAEVHLGLAALKMVRYLDWPAAEKHALRAIELNPQFDEAHYLYSFFLGVLGRWDEAITEGKKALACDPFSVRICQHIGNIFYNARRYHEAVQQYQRTLELDPQNSPAHDSLADAYEQLGQRSETVAQRLRSAELSQDVEMAEILSSGGDGHRSRRALVSLAEKRLERLIQKRKRGAHVPAINIARAYIRMGDKENALSWLQTASEERNVFALTMGNDPFYDPLRIDKRFGEILQRINLPVCQSWKSKERNA
jgi:tetratricopeptide (TPR) repeat protein